MSCVVNLFRFWLLKRGHENDISLVNKQERALSTLKVNPMIVAVLAKDVSSIIKGKLLERISDSSERERLLQEYQINLKVFNEEIKK